jgi:MFS transporter, DHA2 family, multidrug resistance protein
MSGAEDDPLGRVLATIGIMLATAMITLDSTIANVALPHIQGSLSASTDQITWVLTSYIVATAIMAPLSGWLSLKIGRRPMFLFSVVAFVGASTLCGMATSLEQMVLFRLLQGFAGASMMPLSQAAIVDLWSYERMPTLMAIWSAVITVGPIVGPTLGGFLTEHYSWRWVFYINVPVGVIAFLLIYLNLKRDGGGLARPFDFLGFIALVMFTGGVQLMADRGPTLDWFYSPEIWAEALIAGLGFYLFAVQILTAEHPFFPRGILQDRNFLTSVVFSFFVGAILLSSSALLPTFMQNLLGYSAEQSGLVSMWRGLGAMLSFAVVTHAVRRVGPRLTMLTGIACTVFGLWGMTQFDLLMTSGPLKFTGFMQGVGMGLMFTPLGVLGFATLKPALRTEAAVFGNVSRTVAGSLGIAFVQAMLIQQSALAHSRLTEHITADRTEVRWALSHQFSDRLGGLAALNGEITRQAAMMGYDAVFAVMVLVAVLMIPLLFFLRPARGGLVERVEIHPE